MTAERNTISHTPGPWKVEPFVDAIHVSAADDSLVADVADRRLDAEGMPPANARLIAASPDLLAAAVTVIEGLDARIVAASQAGQPCPVFDGIAELYAAICKAKGGQR